MCQRKPIRVDQAKNPEYACGKSSKKYLPTPADLQPAINNPETNLPNLSAHEYSCDKPDNEIQKKTTLKLFFVWKKINNQQKVDMLDATD